VYLPIFHYGVLVYSKLVAKFIEQKGYILYAKNDYNFMDAILNMMEIHFNLKPKLTLNQFFSPSYVEEKIRFAIDLINAIKAKHSTLSRRSSSVKENVHMRKENE
jgi:hypothetical protein